MFRGGAHRESLALGRSAGLQTGLEQVGGMVDTLQPEHTLSRFENRRSAKDSRMRSPQCVFYRHRAPDGAFPKSNSAGSSCCDCHCSITTVVRGGCVPTVGDQQVEETIVVVLAFPRRPILLKNRGGDGSSPAKTRGTQDMGTSRPHPGSWAQSASKCRGSLIMAPAIPCRVRSPGLHPHKAARL